MEKHSKLIATVTLAIAALTLGMFSVPMVSAHIGGGGNFHNHGGFHGGGHFGGFGGHGFGGWGWGNGGFGFCQSVPYWVAVHHGCYSDFF